jgi:DNA-binding MarR family transcriptional regulator/N-acetylglutamate synthase-like GNAT family acetyltransferase
VIIDSVNQFVDHGNGMGNGRGADQTSVTQIEAVRRFNRFYTVEIGVLNQGMLDSPLALTELRVLYELSGRQQATAAELGKELRLDPGYLSRIVRRFHERGWLRRDPSSADGRQIELCLTGRGKRAFAGLDRRARDQIGALLGRCSPLDQERLIAAMATIERALGGPSPSGPGASFVIRQHQPGDLGWIVDRHGALYRREYGMDERFEALVARIAADFLARHDPRRERCWIAERDGERVGSIMLVAKSKRVAKLRCLLVDPSARGLGIGARLVDEVVRFARQAGYRSITLWTTSALVAAGHIYQAAGFQLTEEAPDELFPPGQLGQTWDLTLGPEQRGERRRPRSRPRVRGAMLGR